MRWLFHRLERIERCLPGPAQPIKKIVPDWLIQEFQKQGIPVADDGRPELKPVPTAAERVRMAALEAVATNLGQRQ